VTNLIAIAAFIFAVASSGFLIWLLFQPYDEPDPRLVSLRDWLQRYSDRLDDTANGGRNARSPDGDDYNEVWSEVMSRLDRILGDR
jgi:hypothetical protein